MYPFRGRFSYIILYREAISQQKMIKIQQIPQQDVEGFTKESKALKTTVFVVGSMVVCFLPMGYAFFVSAIKLNVPYPQPPWVRTCVMLNSLPAQSTDLLLATEGNETGCFSNFLCSCSRN